MEPELTPLEQAVWGGLVVVHGKLRRQLDEALQEGHGLSHAEFEVLLLLSWAPERRLRLSDLSAKSLFSLSGMSRLVDRLEQAGLVARATASEDRRGAYAQLTDKGLTQFQAAKATDTAVVRRHFLSLYSEPELATMASLWRRYLDRNPPPGQNSAVAEP